MIIVSIYDGCCNFSIRFNNRTYGKYTKVGQKYIRLYDIDSNAYNIIKTLRKENRFCEIILCEDGFIKVFQPDTLILEKDFKQF